MVKDEGNQTFSQHPSPNQNSSATPSFVPHSLPCVRYLCMFLSFLLKQQSWGFGIILPHLPPQFGFNEYVEFEFESILGNLIHIL